ELKTEAMRDVVGRMFLVTLSDPENLLTAISAFDNNPLIEFAEPDYFHYFDYVPDDPLISSWYHLTNVEAYLAWDFIRGDSTDRAVIGIVDSGVYYDHPDLEPNMWINEPEDIDGDGIFTSADINGIDEDDNGYIDDVVGYDLAMSDNNPEEPIPWHGTHVAGCATMATDNGYGGAGVGWAARIMAVKVARDNNPNSISHGYAGIIYAAENGANVINLSWGRGGGYSQGEQNVINTAYDLGVVVVAAAGNDNSSSRHWPSAYEHVVAVAATDINDEKASFSNFGDWVAVSAPGNNINSTWDHDSFTAASGTSMASPVAAGVVCLIRSANPRWSVDEIVARLLETADNIDDINPGYEGLLGTGRVNAAAAIGQELFPRLDISRVDITLTEDDGDDVLNPGESFEIVVTIENAWADAFNVEGTLRSTGPFTINDSTATFGDINGNGGSSDNSDSPYTVTVAQDALIGDHQLTLALTADGYSAESEITVYVSLQQQGFPGDIPDNIESSPLIFDVDQDGDKEIIISANDHNFYSFEHDGSITEGWPQAVNDIAPNGAAIGDIDNDGDFEIVGAAKSGNIYVWDPDGSPVDGFPYNGGPIMFATPSLEDIDGSGDLEIITAGFGSRKVFVVDHDGSDYPGWPFQGTAVFYGSVALADMDNDELPEIIACDFDGVVYVWNGDQTYVDGFPVTLSGPIQASPSVADVDGDGNLNIIVPTFSGDLFVLDNDGSVLSGWPVSVESNVKSSPSLGDIDNDGHLEILMGDNNGALHVYNANGQPQGGFPINTGGSISGSPVIGDINGDGISDIVVGSSDGFIYAFGGSGNPLPNFPIPTISGGSIIGSAGLADLDNDGDAEIVVGVRSPGNNLEVIDYKDEISSDDFPWPIYGRDIFRTAYYGDFITDIEDDIISSPIVFELLNNYPNPFNGNTIIRFSIPAASGVELSIFDLLGRKLRTLVSDRLEIGTHEFVWDGSDNVGNAVASGVYFYNLKYGEKSITKRMVMLK
ncbi:MAG: S8 family serine peptidase, partial [candidate division Zixibacteria bacterium]